MRYEILFMLLLIGCCVSCEDMLRMVPENSVTFENAYETERDIEMGMYSMERSVRGNLALKNIEKPARNGLYSDYHSRYDNALLAEHEPSCYVVDWTPIYDLIAIANVPLPYIDKVDMPQERRNFYRGQIYFTKALAYFELIRRWGDCVLIRDEVELNVIPKSPWTEVADYAIELVRQAVDLLPEFNELRDSQGSTILYKSTPCRGAANTLFAHLCAWKAGCKYFAPEDDSDYDDRILWQRVDSACTAVILSGVYELAETPELVCTSTLVGGDKESIYESVMRGFWNELEKEDPSPLDDQAFCFGRLYQTWPVVPGEGRGDIDRMDNRILNTTVRKMYPTRIDGGEEITDLRRDAYFYNFDQLDSLNYSIYAYPYKWRLARLGTMWNNEGEFVNFDQNKIWWRLADVILLRAEARVRLGNNQGAIEDLNIIRKRASAQLYDASEYNGDLRYAVFKEREKELLMEGQRYYDVIRNGYYATELYGGFRKVSLQDIRDGVFFNAIADKEFGDNPLARQNTYWLRRL